MIVLGDYHDLHIHGHTIQLFFSDRGACYFSKQERNLRAFLYFVASDRGQDCAIGHVHGEFSHCFSTNTLLLWVALAFSASLCDIHDASDGHECVGVKMVVRQVMANQSLRDASIHELVA